jgi:hypothetical protein
MDVELERPDTIFDIPFFKKVSLHNINFLQ